MRGGGTHVKEAMERPGNALSWRGPATPSRSRSTPTPAGESDPRFVRLGRRTSGHRDSMVGARVFVKK